MATILFLKKNFEKNFFFQILRGQKSKIGSLYEFIPGFPKRLVFLSDCPETLRLWSMPFEMKVLKFEHLTIFCSQDIAIQRLNLFPKIDPHRNFFVFGAIFRVQ